MVQLLFLSVASCIWRLMSVVFPTTPSVNKYPLFLIRGYSRDSRAPFL
jgi:hypothetical protein